MEKRAYRTALHAQSAMSCRAKSAHATRVTAVMPGPALATSSGAAAPGAAPPASCSDGSAVVVWTLTE